MQIKSTGVHAPRFPKRKDEGWWVVLGDPAAGELVALRYASPCTPPFPSSMQRVMKTTGH